MIHRGVQGLPIECGSQPGAALRRAAIAVTIALSLLASTAARAVEPFYFSPTDYLILSADGARTLGYSSFRLNKTPGGETVLSGDARYLNGETDYENVSLQLSADGLPRPTAYEHLFFYAD